MGDVLLATPFIRQLRRRFPASRIDFLVEDKFAEILRFNPHVSSVIEYQKSSSSISNGTFSTSKYDVVIDLQKNLRSRKIRANLSENILSIDKSRLKKFALVQFKWNLYHEIQPIAEKYRATARSIGVEDDGDGLELWLPEEASQKIYPPTKRNVSALKNKIAIAPGAHHATKRWLPERFAETAFVLSQKFQTEIILLGGKEDRELCSILQKNIPAGVKVWDFSGATSISETARHLDKCSLLISNDTGIMHIAAARRVPVVAVFGSTVRAFGFEPFRVPHVVVDKDLACRPCTHIGRAKCPKKHFNCMKLIQSDDVAQAAEKLLTMS